MKIMRLSTSVIAFCRLDAIPAGGGGALHPQRGATTSTCKGDISIESWSETGMTSVMATRAMSSSDKRMVLLKKILEN